MIFRHITEIVNDVEDRQKEDTREVFDELKLIEESLDLQINKALNNPLSNMSAKNKMKLEIKTVLPYLVLFGTLANDMGYVVRTFKCSEVKADSVAKMQQDLAVIKVQIQAIDEKMAWMEEVSNKEL